MRSLRRTNIPEGPEFARRGENVQLADGSTFAYPENIEFGDHIYIGPGAQIFADATVRIGTGTIFGPRVTIHTVNHNFDSPDLESVPYDYRSYMAPVVVGECVWIGDQALITAGTTIGDGAVVAAGSVVTKDVESCAIVAGNPARLIRHRDREQFERLRSDGRIYLAMKQRGEVTTAYLPASERARA